MSKIKNSWKLMRSCPKTENSITYGLLTKCEVKMAVYSPRSFFFACLWIETECFLRDTAGSPEQARWLHLARSGSQSRHRIRFILPAHGANNAIKVNSVTVKFNTGEGSSSCKVSQA